MIGPFSTDSYIPNLPQMTKDLHTTASLAGATLQFNWIVKAVSTVAIGFLSDRPAIGRRRAILGAFVFYVVGTAGCALVPGARGAGGIYWLIGFRVVQAVGEAATAVTSAVARDVLSDPDEMMRMMALLGSLRPLMIVVAPSVGGVLGSLFGWRLVFAWSVSEWRARLERPCLFPPPPYPFPSLSRRVPLAFSCACGCWTGL